MRKALWACIVLPSACMAFIASVRDFGATSLSSEVWNLPLAVSLASISVLVANLATGRFGLALPGRFVSGAYVACGLSAAMLILSPFGLGSPAWLCCTSPALVLVSAWTYYSSLRDPEGGAELSGGSYGRAQGQCETDFEFILGFEMAPQD